MLSHAGMICPKCFLRVFKKVLLLALFAIVFAGGVGCTTTRSYRVTEKYLFSARQADAEVFLGVTIPKSGPYQEVKNLKISGCKVIDHELKDELDVVKLGGSVSKEKPLEAVITYDIRLSRKRPRWEAPVEPAHLNPQSEIESDNPALRECASELVSGRSREDVYKIYAFVGKRVRQPKGPRINRPPPSALKAYQTGIGVCGECANLMTALCRAAGIPARTVVGLSFVRPLTPFFSVTRTWNHPAVAHSWVEYHTERGWETTDPSFARVVPLRRLLFTSHTNLLSYGEKDACDEAHSSAYKWCEAHGELVTSMSGPLRFVATATTKTVRLTPSVTVKKRWRNP